MKYEVIIGLEIHAQLATNSKMFCGCDNRSFAEATDGKQSEQVSPNDLTCPICMGMPGTLPVINKKALEWTYLFGLALNCKIADQFNFERKQYFYPDLPKAYQITSQTTPPLIGGYLDIRGDWISPSTEEIQSPLKRFTIEHVHLEEDAGKLIHSGDHSLVDLNRAGTPLMEIVTNPDFRSPLEAKTFMQELQRILRYLGISSADMEKGHLRCDGNISLRLKSQDPNPKSQTNPKSEIQNTKLGTKVEIKNLNSFAALEKALEYEIKRQSEILDKGELIDQETRGWDDVKGITVSQRGKEMAHDYRYFPEPDLPPIVIGENQKSKIKSQNSGVPSGRYIDIEALGKLIPELPAGKRKRYAEEFRLDKKSIDILVDDISLANYFESAVGAIHESPEKVKKISNWLLGDALGYLNAKNETIAELKIKPQDLVELIEKVDSGEISSKIAKEVFIKMADTGKSSTEIIESEGIKQVSDTGELEKIVGELVAANPAQVEQYKKELSAGGDTPVLNWFVGQVMKVTRGQANPGVVMDLLRKLLG